MTVTESISNPLLLDVSTLRLTDDQFYQLCISNPAAQLELTAQGVPVAMSPVGGDSGKREANLITDLNIWNRRTGLGEVFSSSTVFKLPKGSQRSPDAAWIECSRWAALTSEQQQVFPPIVPDFVIELRSRTDSLADLQAKLREYQDNGVRLGLLINPQAKQVEIYRLNGTVEVLQSPTQVSGEDVLPGFELDLSTIW